MVVQDSMITVAILPYLCNWMSWSRRVKRGNEFTVNVDPSIFKSSFSITLGYEFLSSYFPWWHHIYPHFHRPLESIPFRILPSNPVSLTLQQLRWIILLWIIRIETQLIDQSSIDGLIQYPLPQLYEMNETSQPILFISRPSNSFNT